MKINFENLFEEKILKKGYNYYVGDCVHDVSKEEQQYEAVVYGTEIYEVQARISDNGNVEYVNCDCPYSGNCKHIAALLYYLENDGEVEDKRKLRKYESFDTIVDKIPEGEIKNFIIQKLSSEKNFQNEFRSYFVQYFDKTPKKVYEKRISQSIYQAIGRKGFIEYNETDRFSDPMYDYIQEARNLIKHNEYQAPFWIASLILEKLPDLPIDDSDGTTSYIESICVEVIEEILKKCNNRNITNEIFEWIISVIKEDTLGDYTDEVERILDEYFQEDQCIDERMKIIEEKIKVLEKENDHYSEYHIVDLLKTKIALLYQKGEDEKALETIVKNKNYVPIRKMLIEKESQEGNTTRVIELLEEGLQLSLKEKYYGVTMYFVDELLKLYQENDIKKYKELLENTLFKYSRCSFKYYRKYKELYEKSEWNKKKDEVIKDFESDGKDVHRDDLRQIYIEEKYYDKLYKSVMNTPLFSIILQYEKYLIKDYEKELLEKYQEIANETARFTGKRNYEEIRKILEHMRTLENGEKLVWKIVEEYKVKYSNRKLMLEELNKIRK